MRRRLGLVVFLVVATAATACASTAQVAGGQLPSGVASDGSAVVLDDGLGLPEDGTDDGMSVGGGSPAEAGAPDGSTTPAGGGSGGGAVAAGQGSGGTTQPTTSGSGGAPATAGGSAEVPGVTADTIRIGLEYTSDSKEANAALGENVSGGDPKANYTTLIKYYNARGGFAGRKIEPVYFEYSAFQELGPQQQEACAYFTQDQPVYAVYLLDADEAYVNCLTKAGIGAWGSEGLTASDDDMFARYPTFAMPSALSLTQVARLYAPGLRNAGFFEPEAVDKSTTIGLVTFNEPRYEKAAKEFEASLASVGESLDEKVFVHYAKTTDQAGQLSAEVSSAVLRFRQEGVDHVTIIEESALIALFFQQAAERQGYRPQYGFNSTSGGQLYIDLGLSEPNQMANSRLVGWSTPTDLPPRYVKPWPEQQECLRMYEEAGIQTSGNARALALLACAGFDFMQAALGAAPGPLTVSSIQAGMERLGTSWRSPWNQTTRFGPGRHYGSALYRTAAYEAACNCFKPNGPVRPIP